MHGRVEIRLDRAESVARVTVSDKGAGIKPQLLPQIFERFRQGERPSGGLGLGLPSCATSSSCTAGPCARRAGGGARRHVHVELPALNESGTVAAAGPHRVEGSVGPRLTPLQGLRLLVVEDEPDARELLSMILQEAGAEVAAAGSASEALAAFERLRRTSSSATSGCRMATATA